MPRLQFLPGQLSAKFKHALGYNSAGQGTRYTFMPPDEVGMDPKSGSYRGPASFSPVMEQNTTAALPAKLAAEAAGPSPLPPPPMAPCKADTAAALARLQDAWEQQHRDRWQVASAIANSSSPGTPVAASPPLNPALYLTYDCRYSNPMSLLGTTEDITSDCHIIVQAATASRRATAASSSASPWASSSCAEDCGVQQLMESGRSSSEEFESHGWPGLQLGAERELDILTVIPNAAYRL